MNNHNSNATPAAAAAATTAANNNQNPANANNPNDGRYEGCGEEGPLRSIFFAEFHPTAGPIIRCQAPAKGPTLISKDIFDAIRCLLLSTTSCSKRGPLLVPFNLVNLSASFFYISNKLQARFLFTKKRND